MAVKHKLTPILDGAYLVVGLVPGPCGSVLGEVDLSTIKADVAERLIKAGFPYLKKAPEKLVKKVRRVSTK